MLEATTPRAGEYERLVFFDPPGALAEMRAWLPGVRLLAQSGDDLGARMSDAFARAFARGARRVAIIGTDAPGVSRETVIEALDALAAADVVLGPAEDGGYFLIALREPQPELFQGIDWSTGAVLRQTLTRAAAAGLSVHELGPVRDLDTLDDLRAEWPGLESRLEPELRQALARALEASAIGSRSPRR